MGSTALVRPGDITDAVDSNDLVQILLSTNLERIDEGLFLAERKKWLEDERKRIKKEYYIKAEKAYEQMWSRCSKSVVGHDNVGVETNGFTARTCRLCSFTSLEEVKNDHFGHGRDRNKVLSRMNRDLIQVLATKMVELDEEAGVLVWPEEDDYAKSPSAKIKKKLFR